MLTGGGAGRGRMRAARWLQAKVNRGNAPVIGSTMVEAAVGQQAMNGGWS